MTLDQLIAELKHPVSAYARAWALGDRIILVGWDGNTIQTVAMRRRVIAGEGFNLAWEFNKFLYGVQRLKGARNDRDD